MSKTISFISRKGGTGKTTNAIHLATMLHSIGHKVLIMETDTNYTLATLRQMELSEGHAGSVFPIEKCTDKKAVEVLERAKASRKYTYIIVDSAGKTTDKHIRKLALNSDLVIVPTSLSQNDLVVTYLTVQDIAGAQEHRPDLEVAVLPNALHSQTGQKRIRKNLEDLDNVIILENFVPRRKNLAEFSTLTPEAAYLPLTNEILHILEG